MTIYISFCSWAGCDWESLRSDSPDAPMSALTEHSAHMHAGRVVGGVKKEEAGEPLL